MVSPFATNTVRIANLPKQPQKFVENIFKHKNVQRELTSLDVWQKWGVYKKQHGKTTFKTVKVEMGRR